MEFGAIGRRYRRRDEIGTPFCVTVDFDSLTDHVVTVRERDSMAQQRVAMDQVESLSRGSRESAADFWEDGGYGHRKR